MEDIGKSGSQFRVETRKNEPKQKEEKQGLHQHSRPCFEHGPVRGGRVLAPKTPTRSPCGRVAAHEPCWCKIRKISEIF